ncbi:MAG: tRNA (adenosine(37)-N6)-threonylcarbamoyltransferase complex ATPase subunit type 1 TsaE [Spirochaetales bacterium]|nr:MAG: tRNA (adenosine(37)-N6)-threonylcarbamoyltransferase complex ATPase subunit type 1 TsaE [Spirochaetales bacterium]
MEFTCASVEDTEALGERLSRAATPNTVIAFRGGLGAGKTAMARGLARGLGIRDLVTSPTYTLVNEYDGGRLPFFHVDAYRLSSAGEFEFMDARSYLYGGGLCAIEWSERVRDALPADAVIVDIEPLSDGSRKIRIEGALEEIVT